MTERPDLRVVGGSNAAWKSRDEWLAAGKVLGERTERDRWALGDWACHGERDYGDLAEAAVKIGVGYQTLRNLAMVARKVELSRRRDNLGWSHHAEVAARSVTVGDDLLARAEAEGWSRAVLREEARAASELERLRAANRKLAEENEQLRQSSSQVRDLIRQTRARMKAESRVTREAVNRTVDILNELTQPEIASKMHGNNGLAREAQGVFRVLAAEVRTGRIQVSGIACRLAGGDRSNPLEATVVTLTDEIEEALREIAQVLGAATLSGEQAEALAATLDARMAVIADVLESGIRPALKGRSDGDQA